MIQKVFAFVTACSIVAGLTGSAIGAPTATPTLSQSICNTSDLNDIIAVYNFDSPNYKRSPETLPPGVKSYLAALLTGRLNACAALAGPGATQKACMVGNGENDPHDLWEHLKFCEGVLGLPPRQRDQPLIAAREPTIYVLLSIGAGPGGAPGGTSGAKSSAGGGGSPAGGRGGSGPATGSSATGSSVDNPAYFLLFIIAQHIERDICTRSNIATKDCDAQHPVAVVPETTWNLEDLRTQCIDDPYVPSDLANPYGLGQSAQAGRGTLGAIVLNGSTVAVDGTFAIFSVYGSSEANFTGQMLDCTSGAGPALAAVWSDNISGSNKTTAISFFPLALAGTLLAANSAAHEAAIPAPGPNASPNSLSNFITYQNDVALGTFAASTSNLTLGNPSSGQTFRHSFESWTNAFVKGFSEFCALQHPELNACKALKL